MEREATQRQLSLIQDLANQRMRDAKKDFFEPMGIYEPDKPTIKQADEIIKRLLQSLPSTE
jgi:hypothetical protein